jgi:DtxR family Mn-dependent transcriptional regulator
MSKITSVEEEYIQTIYRLEKQHGIARTSDIANLLQVALGTVTNTVDRLKKQELVIHKPYKGVKLTDRGRRIALKIIRKHRVSERFLTDIVKMDWSEVHDIACRLEHAMTEDVIIPLEEVLGNPKTCPHGNPIPTKDGKISEEESYPLIEMKEGTTSFILKVVNEEPNLLRYLKKIDLVPGKRVEVLEKTPFEGLLTVKIDGKKKALSRIIASRVWVKKVVD